MEQLVNGDLVEWTSSSAGVTTTKRGQVVCVVPARMPVNQATSEFSRTKGRIRYPGSWRDHESYVIRTERTNGGQSGGKLRWPRVKHLRKVG